MLLLNRLEWKVVLTQQLMDGIYYIDKLYNLISVKSCTCCSYNTVRGKSEHIQQLQLAGHCAPEWVVTSIIVAICKGAFPPDTSSAGA